MKNSLNKSYSLILVLFLSTALYADPHIVAGGNNKTTTRGKCEYSLYDKLLLQQQYWYKPNSAVFHNPSWVVADYNSEDRIYVKWKNIKASAYPQIISADFWNFRGNESYDSLSIPAFTLTMPTPSFTAGTSLNIPCYITNATTISLNSYINSDAGSVGIDQNEVITDEFEWTLPSGWQTTSGQSGTFVSSSSISVIPPASSSPDAISVRAKANTQYSLPAILQITRNLRSFALTGPATVLCNTTHRYTVPSTPGVSYTWQLPNGWVGTSSTNFIDAIASGASGSIICTMTGCNENKPSTPLQVSVNIIDPSTSISGPSIVCSSGAQFTVNNVSGATVSWTCSTNLSFDNQTGNPKVFTANGTGTGTIQAILSSTCGNVTLPAQIVWVGTPPTPETMYGFCCNGLEFGSNSVYNFSVDNWDGNLNDFEWVVGGGTIISGQGTNAISVLTTEVTGPINVYFDVAVRAGNCNSWSNYYFRNGYVTSGIGPIEIIVTPNPSTSEANIQLVSTNEQALTVDTEWNLEVYDSMQNLKTKSQKFKGSRQTINTSSWKDGVYIVRVKIGKEIISEKLVVKH